MSVICFCITTPRVFILVPIWGKGEGEKGPLVFWPESWSFAPSEIKFVPCYHNNGMLLWDLSNEALFSDGGLTLETLAFPAE